MEVVEQIRQMAAITKKAAREDLKVGLVPTMGALHEGHLSLIRRARKQSDVVTASIFVNPVQFGQNEDFDSYPRELSSDLRQLSAAGVDYVFVPTAAEMYPPEFSTWIMVEGLSHKLCGISRPQHFRGVTTVVGKLIHILQPAFAFFGQKDAQQTIIIRRMLSDLNLETELVVCPTVRESDGLAISSRNRYLNGPERNAATVLIRSLRAAQQMMDEGARDGQQILDKVKRCIEGEPLARIDYIALVDNERLNPVISIDREALLAVAVFIGKTRLIDNLPIHLGD
ncbi:MAG: pantoate--beta-alanine ligase [Acidobacteria bacterium]|nr:pantoate--beta-alanine ligase [Acidobacteriota bacterium]MBI3656206.1 pantoate--beta-alanine ligase [Acidobacteriota bacterium]